MKVFITGGSGFVGKAVINQLLRQGHAVHALVRNPESLTQKENLATVTGDTTQPASLKDKLAGCDAVVHLVGIIREIPRRGITFERLHKESTANMLEAATEQNVPRFLHMSANGTREGAMTSYHKTKWKAEELVRNSDLNWTIFRPSLIFGAEDGFINMLARMIRRSPFVPVFGDGHYQLQPVHVHDIAKAFTSALDLDISYAQTYSCCGPRVLSYNQLLDTIGQALNLSRVRKIHQPLAVMKPLIQLMQSCPQFPITSDQLQMLLEGNCCKDNRWRTDLQIDPTPLDSINDYLN